MKVAPGKPDSQCSTAALILAAGASQRFGSPKQTVLYAGQTLLERTVTTALESPVGAVIVVLGANASVCQTALRAYPVKIVVNRQWSSGISSSIRVGLNTLAEVSDASEEKRFDSALFLTCDQPFLSAGLISELVAKYQARESRIVASAYADCLGIPALFDRSLFPQLLELEGASGARALITKFQDIASAVPFPLGEIDIDTAADLAQLSGTENQ